MKHGDGLPYSTHIMCLAQGLVQDPGPYIGSMSFGSTRKTDTVFLPWALGGLQNLLPQTWGLDAAIKIEAGFVHALLEGARESPGHIVSTLLVHTLHQPQHEPKRVVFYILLG